MNTVIHPNRWFIWALVSILVVGLLTFSYIKYQDGELDEEVAGIYISQ